MKKEKNPDPQIRRNPVLLKVLMIFAISLYCFAVSAQTSTVSATAIADEKPNFANTPYESLAEFVKQHPSDAKAAQALKYAIILQNPNAYSEFQTSDLDRMKVELNASMSKADYLNQQIEQGATYENAEAVYQRKLELTRLQQEAINEQQPIPAQNSNDSQEPALRVNPN